MAFPAQIYDGFLPGRHVIAGVGQGGFRFGEMSHQGGILALPSGIRRWSPPSPLGHDEVLYAGVFAEADAIDILLIGTGVGPVPLPDALRWRFRDHRIAADVMTTSSAASTYNVLLDEGRRVAAALVAIP
jgi:uncharacterized protein